MAKGVPLGSPLFPSQSMLVSEYSANSVATYTIDANGNPVLASRKTFITGLAGAEGAAIDPVTGDFYFSTYGGANQIIQVRGFIPPAPPAPPPSATPALPTNIPTLSTWALLATSVLVLATGFLFGRKRRQ